MMNATLKAILDPAYPYCPGFAGACRGHVRFDPVEGHIPRGFCGATGALEDIELVMVLAEPGPPNGVTAHTMPDVYAFAESWLLLSREPRPRVHAADSPRLLPRPVPDHNHGEGLDH